MKIRGIQRVNLVDDEATRSTGAGAGADAGAGSCAESDCMQCGDDRNLLVILGRTASPAISSVVNVFFKFKC